MKYFMGLALFAFFGLLANAQSNKEDIAIIQSMFGKAKKDLVTQYMTIPADKADAFWKTYDEYEAARTALGRERISMIEAYANSYLTMDDKKAGELMSNKFKWVGNYSKMQKKYYNSFAKVIGATQASKLMQLEDYIENNIRLSIQESIPFIDELDKTKLKEATQQ
jgi:ATP-dependent protease HslVU (ClpYQ) ATPase subunit